MVGTIIAAGIMGILALVCFVLSWRQFREKGYLFNNAWIYATKKERESLNKKPYYRQSGIVFCLLGLLFTLIGLHAILQDSRLLWLEAALVVGTIAYAILSSLRIMKEEETNPKPRN